MHRCTPRIILDWPLLRGCSSLPAKNLSIVPICLSRSPPSTLNGSVDDEGNKLTHVEHCISKAGAVKIIVRIREDPL